MVTASASPAALAADHTRALLDAASLTRPYRAAIEATLAIPGGTLSDLPEMRWARLVWTCCAAAGGSWEQAAPVAAAAELFMSALDLLDDAEDGEPHPAHALVGFDRALNVSTGLLFLAHQALLAQAGVAAAGVLLRAGLCACGGQHADLTPPAERCADLDWALDVASRKSASLVAALCRLGALAAGATEETAARYAAFGHYLGLSRQLANDVAALGPDAAGKTDNRLGRPTLPLVHDALHPAGRQGEHLTVAVSLAWAVAETYRLHALALAEQFTTDPSGRDSLEQLVARI